MEKPSTELQVAHTKRLIEEFTHGQELVKKLKVIIDEPFGEDKYSVANDLLVNISSLFMGSISMMNHNQQDGFSENAIVGVAEFNARKEDSADNSKTPNPRGCYKRRKTSQSSIQIIPNLINDGYAWRKYGQKRIQNAKQPRNYFRCTHKFDQGCQATKQVQKTENEPPMYQITYQGKHTCKNPTLTTPQLIFDTTHYNDSKNLISFQSSNKLHEGPKFPNFHFLKEEQSLTMDNKSPPSYQRHMSPDQMTVGSFGPKSVLSSGYDDTCDLLSYSRATSVPSDGFDPIGKLEGFHGFRDKFAFEFQHCYT